MSSATVMAAETNWDPGKRNIFLECFVFYLFGYCLLIKLRPKSPKSRAIHLLMYGSVDKTRDLSEGDRQLVDGT